MAVENDEIFGGHSRPKMAFKTTSQAAQVSSFVKRGSEPKSFGFLITSMIVGLRFTICRLRSVTAVTSVQNKDLGAISSRSQVECVTATKSSLAMKNTGLLPLLPLNNLV